MQHNVYLAIYISFVTCAKHLEAITEITSQASIEILQTYLLEKTFLLFFT